MIARLDRTPFAGALDEFVESTLTKAGVVVLDRQREETPFGSAVRTLSLTLGAAEALVVEQWWWTRQGQARVLTCTCTPDRYELEADEFRSQLLAVE